MKENNVVIVEKNIIMLENSKILEERQVAKRKRSGMEF